MVKIFEISWFKPQFLKISIFVKIFWNRFFRKFLIISFVVQISDNLYFVQNFRKMTISSKIFTESRFWSKLFKISIFVNLYR